MAERVAIILAAGVSSRMVTKLPKVLHEVCGRPMLAYVLDACRQAGLQKIVAVVGYNKEQIMDYFKDDPDIIWVSQDEQKGTGHAVMCCKEHLKEFDGEVMILCGDGPLIRSETLKTLIDKHEAEHASATLATAVLKDPTGYGRITRDACGNMQGIVEHSDCTPEQLSIKEVNPSYYLFKSKVLFEALDKVQPNNVKGEYYLTDALYITISSGHKVVAVTAVSEEDAMGVNSRRQLSLASRIMQNRIQDKLMVAGVTIVDPQNTWIDARAKIGQDTVIEPFTYIHGVVEIGRNCRVGPFAYLRDGTILKDDVVLGVFTEVKNSLLDNGVRARHQSYIGDTELGENVNLGAGSITANFDGANINKTKVGKDSHIGAGVILIAPLELEEGSNISSGTVVSKDQIRGIEREG